MLDDDLNRRLANMINGYWASKGYFVRAAHDTHVSDEGRTVGCVVSTLKNGLPAGYKPNGEEGRLYRGDWA